MEDLILRLRLSVSIFLLLILFSCEKQGKYLPAMTHEGRNTIGFIDGSGEVFGGATHQVNYDSTNQLLSVIFLEIKNGWNFDSEWRLELELKYNNTLDSFLFYNATYNAKYDHFAIDSSTYNNFEITYFDKSKRILSVNFDFNMVAIVDGYDTTYADTTRLVQINKGRFDIKYPQ